MQRKKIVLLGGRHTGQGPIGRAWGRTPADLPDLQPVCIYTRQVDQKDEETWKVDAWVLSLDPRFEYMRRSMYLQSDAFIFTFDAQSQPAASISYLSPFMSEIKDTLDLVPPLVLVACRLDPTLEAPGDLDAIIENETTGWGISRRFDLDLTSKKLFIVGVEKIFNSLLALLR